MEVSHTGTVSEIPYKFIVKEPGRPCVTARGLVGSRPRPAGSKTLMGETSRPQVSLSQCKFLLTGFSPQRVLVVTE